MNIMILPLNDTIFRQFQSIVAEFMYLPSFDNTRTVFATFYVLKFIRMKSVLPKHSTLKLLVSLLKPLD